MKMTNKLIVLLAVAGLAAGVASAADITWGGSTGDWNTEGVADANWTGGTSPVMDGTDNVIINGGTVTYNAGALGDMGNGWGSSDVTINGGTLQQTTTHWMRWYGTGTMTVNAGGTFNSAASTTYYAGGNVMVNAGGSYTGNSRMWSWANSTLTANGGSLTHNGFEIGAGSSVNALNGGTVSANGGDLIIKETGAITVSGAGSTLTKGNNGSIVLGATSSQKASLTIADDGTLTHGGELWMGSAAQAGGYAADLIIDNGALTLTGGGGASLFLWTDGTSDLSLVDYNINFLSEGGSLSVGAAGIEVDNDNVKLTYENLWDAGVLQWQGGNEGSFADHFVVSGTQGSDGYTVTAIPEPATLGMVVAFGGSILFIRRKLMI